MTSKQKVKIIKSPKAVIRKVRKVREITQYRIPANGLTILYVRRKGTGVVTSDITYRVGSRDEECGETGLAHMLEHMLFKPTKFDIVKKKASGATVFEQEVGVVFNATTWKDRTTYYFSYPSIYFDRALKIESERMCDVVLTNKEFLPERTNVLSEFDMNAGDEEFLLAVQIAGTALHSHPYGHETIGYREDIERYTVKKLHAFYKKYYAPNNATLIIVGDIDEKTMLESVRRNFAHIQPSKALPQRKIVIEPKQEGLRTLTIQRPSTINILGIGVRHEGFPSKAWFETMIAFDVLVGGKDSILYRAFVDKGKAIAVHGTPEPTYDANCAIVFITLAQKSTHDQIYKELRNILDTLTPKDIAPYLKRIIAKTITEECTGRENSLGFVSELLEYVSANAWEQFYESENMLRTITAKDVCSRVKALFREDAITMGKFLGKK